jgi:hypothetical protein
MAIFAVNFCERFSLVRFSISEEIFNNFVKALMAPSSQLNLVLFVTNF